MKAKSKAVRVVQRRPTRQRKPVHQHAIVKATPPTVAEAIEKVLIQGDLSALTPEQRLEYYRAVCKSLGLNALTRPFSYIAFKETENSLPRLALYATRDCGDQLRKLHGVAVTKSERSMDEDFVTVSVEVRNREGRTDTGTGVVSLMKWNERMKAWARLERRDLANAIMKAETKAKRRATLSVCGLGFLDESELDTMERGTNYGEVTPSGRHIIEGGPDLKQLASKYTEEIQKKIKEREVDNNAQPVPSLFYVYYEASKTAEISGAQSLMTANKDLLAPLWNGAQKAVVATDEQLEALKFELEKRNVPFKRLRQPGE